MSIKDGSPRPVANSTLASERDPLKAWPLFLMDHIEGQVAFGDTKAGLLLAADSILLAAMGATITGEPPITRTFNALSIGC